MKKKIVGIFICILFVFIPISSAIGINYEFQHNINRCNITTIWVEQTKLLASNGDSNDNFGESVSINGDYAIVGAWLDEENGEDSGSAYIFKRNDANWNEEAILIPSDSIPDVRFGHSVSIDGDYAIVGTCPGKSAYIFKRDGVNWTQQAKLTASDGEEIDCFGISVSIDGDYAIVGAYITGSAYIFKRNGIAWIEEAKMTGMEYSFGHCVSINGDYTIVGDYNGNNDKGAAHIFKRNGTSWMKDAILIASDGEKFADFGDSVSINGEYAIVGSNDDSTINGASSGSAYIFKRNSTSWIEEAKIIASDGEQFDHFGESVSIDGNHAIIGAYWDNDNGKDSGSAYILKKDTLPNKPIITGPTSGNTGNEYDYTLNATDPDGDHVMYFVDWGDNTTEWTEYGDSGEEITLKHTWIEEGDYTIKAKAKDIYDVESNWSKFEVIIPRTRTTSYSFHWLFEHFPLLERLYKLILT